jgi:putative ABC transport system permease protein
MLDLVHIKKDYFIDKVPFTALKDINLSFPDKGFVSILGPSGCGKTTLLNIIGGLDHYTSGDLIINGKSTKKFKDPDWDAYRNEHVGFVFQTYNLVPHMNVLANVEIPLMLNGIGPNQRKIRALKALQEVGLDTEAKKKPNQLSGGQMQRVALARALVNNPKIVLADEPTGALDSVTSVQVMDLLKEVAKDRLVIMVTHNEDLADQYSDRIITMKDGEILADSAPLSPNPALRAEPAPKQRTSMSFFTAFKSSASNIFSKKGRTILTAVAFSFGIIGVALVLAVDNGFSNYVDEVESSVASSVPITISPVYTSYGKDPTATNPYKSGHEIVVYNSGDLGATIHYNNITSDYVNYLHDKLENQKTKLATITENRDGLNFNILTKDGTNDGYIKVAQYDDAGLSGELLSYLGVPSSIFHEISADTKTLNENYEIIDGSFPQNENELVLIVDKYNRVDLSTLKKLGICSSDSSYTNGATISWDDIIYSGEADTAYKAYKAYPNSVFYDVNTKYEADVAIHQINGINIVTNKDSSGNVTSYSVVLSEDSAAHTQHITAYDQPQVKNYGAYFADQTNHPGKELKVVGVLRSKKGSYVEMMPPSIGYVTDLKNDMAADINTEAGTKIASALKTNWAMVKTDDETTDSKKKMETALSAIVNSVKNPESSSDFTGLSTSITTSLASTLRYFSSATNAKNNSPVYWTSKTYAYSYYLNEGHGVSADFNQLKAADFVTDFTKDPSGTLETLNEMISYDPGFLNPSLAHDSKYNPYGISLVDLVAFYKSYSLISSLNISPASLTTKDKVLAVLDDWNNSPEHANQIVKYNDYMGMFTSSLSTLIEVISAVLIVFASISLVVSSVMTGIITYTSVIERTKEIGILRACGARKIDVGRLFETECFIIGLIAGLFGISFTYLACIPIDQIIYNKFGIGTIAFLNPWHGAVLVALAVLLAFLSSLIPAQVAANKDPVTSLRTE